MVWSHDDFIRELSRQLVELETLRRKLEEPGDVGEVIERIEESNRHLLRKMHEFFQMRHLRKADGLERPGRRAHREGWR